LLLFLFKIVHLCSLVIFHYRLKYTQNIIQLLQLSIVFIVIIKYIYNWYHILDMDFKPMNGYHTQLRSNGGTCRRVRETNDGHGQMLETILKRLNNMTMHSPRHDHTTKLHQEEEDTASQIADPGGRGQNRGNLRYRGDEGRKLEVPTFDGVYPNGWLVRMDRFFWVSNILVGEKLDYAVLGLMGEALTRFKWWEAQSTFHTWLRFKQNMLKCFEPGATSNLLVPLLQVKQTGFIM